MVVLGFSNFAICLWVFELPCLSDAAASQRFGERCSMCDLAAFIFLLVFAFSPPKQLHVVNTRAVVDKLQKRKFVLVGFMLAAGLLNTDWVVSDVSTTL